MHASLIQILTLLFSAIFNSSEDPNSAVSQPVLQCVQVKPLVGQQGTPERYRVVFSDINNFVQSMLATRKHPIFATLRLTRTEDAEKFQRQIMLYTTAGSGKAVS